MKHCYHSVRSPVMRIKVGKHWIAFENGILILDDENEAQKEQAALLDIAMGKDAIIMQSVRKLASTEELAKEVKAVEEKDKAKLVVAGSTVAMGATTLIRK